MNVEPSIWGPSGWIFLECIAIGYPNTPTQEQQKYYKNFFANLGIILPCEKCRYNYDAHLTKTSFTTNATIFANRKNLLDWVISIRNNINVINKQPLITYNDVMKELAKTQHTPNSYLLYGIIAILILIIIYLAKYN